MSTDEGQSSDGADGIAELVDTLQDVDTDAPDAGQNETTISDNNGGRIELGEDGSGDEIIRK